MSNPLFTPDPDLPTSEVEIDRPPPQQQAVGQQNSVPPLYAIGDTLQLDVGDYIGQRGIVRKVVWHNNEWNYGLSGIIGDINDHERLWGALQSHVSDIPPPIEPQIPSTNPIWNNTHPLPNAHATIDPYPNPMPRQPQQPLQQPVSPFDFIPEIVTELREQNGLMKALIELIELIRANQQTLNLNINVKDNDDDRTDDNITTDPATSGGPDQPSATGRADHPSGDGTTLQQEIFGSDNGVGEGKQRASEHDQNDDSGL